MRLLKSNNMEYFVCSLCRNGILGGGLFVDETSIVYKTNKLTVPDKFRHLQLNREDINHIDWKGIIATFYMNNDEHYTFLIFNKNRFNRCI